MTKNKYNRYSVTDSKIRITKKVDVFKKENK